MDAAYDQHFATTVITFEEQMRGWMASVRRAKSAADQVRPYDQLAKLIQFFGAWEVLRFYSKCAKLFLDLRKTGIRIGTQDLKIACIAIENNGTLLSSNIRDFEMVNGLTIFDWLHSPKP